MPKERTVPTQDDLSRTEEAAVAEIAKPKVKRRKWSKAAKAAARAKREAREPTHESRAQETHVSPHARWSQPWSRGGALPQDIPPRPGMVQRWIRVAHQGQADVTNASSKMGEGWVPRPASTLPKNYFAPVIEKGTYAGGIGVGGMVLMEMPVALNAQRAAHYKQKSNQQTLAVNHELAKVSKHGSHGFGPIQKGERTEVGTLREVRAAGDDE